MVVRKKVQYLIILILAAAIGYAVVQHFFSSPESAVLGETAPSFSLQDLDGETVQLSDYKGKGVLLNFWATWCTPCVNELPLLNEAYKITGVDMVAINVGEEAQDVQKFVDRYDLVFPIALDSDMQIRQTYGVVGLPVTLLVDADGVLISRHDGQLTEMADIMNLMNTIK